MSSERRTGMFRPRQDLFETHSHIPPRLWLIIAKILGIKLKPNEKPIISSVLHVLTFGSAAALFCTILAYEIQAVISNNTKSDILDGTVSVMVFGYFCGLGRS